VEQPEKTMSTGPVQRWRSAVRCTRGLDAVSGTVRRHG